MTASNGYLETLENIVKDDGRYDIEAYLFVHEVIGSMMKALKRRRHITGRELLEGIRVHALREFGPLSRDVLEHWGVFRCEDFGEIVFSMVDGGILRKTEDDSRDDFKGGYDFREAFEINPPKTGSDEGFK